MFTNDTGHRYHVSPDVFPFNACVARPVPPKEVAKTPKAREALSKEWGRLRAMQCWEENKVRELADVLAESRRSGKTMHFVCVA